MIIEDWTLGGERIVIDTKRPPREPAWLERVRLALEALQKVEWRISELMRLGQLYANDENWEMAGKLSRGIINVKTWSLIDHDRILTGRK